MLIVGFLLRRLLFGVLICPLLQCSDMGVGRIVHTPAAQRQLGVRERLRLRFVACVIRAPRRCGLLENRDLLHIRLRVGFGSGELLSEEIEEICQRGRLSGMRELCERCVCFLVVPILTTTDVR